MIPFLSKPMRHTPELWSGPFPKLWLANAGYYYLLHLGWFLGRDTVLLLFTVWLVWFLIQEVAGAVVILLKAHEPEVIRTFSQLMQFLAHRDTGHGPVVGALIGWDGFVTYTSLLLGADAWMVVHASVGPVQAWIVAVAVPMWNWGHWQHRQRIG